MTGTAGRVPRVGLRPARPRPARRDRGQEAPGRWSQRFQEDETVPFFVLSLKAGGTGLNLTAASHVIHFDRWWNPAVENQATDRAFRIGQTRNVLVHKFVCRGTVEEKIDALIESKRELVGRSARGRRRDQPDRDERRRAAANSSRSISAPRPEGVTLMSTMTTAGGPTCPVAARRRKAARELAKLRKKGQPCSPVVIEGGTIATDVLGQGLVRQPGALQRLREPAAARPDLRAQRLGDRSADRAADGHGAGQRVDDSTGCQVERRGRGQGALAGALRGLRGRHRLAGRAAAGALFQGVMERICRQETGLFPSPTEIRFTCSCPDWASMCKHVAAVLYGIGARLDRSPSCCFACGRSTRPKCCPISRPRCRTGGRSATERTH